MFRSKAIALALGGVMVLSGCARGDVGWFGPEPTPEPSRVEPTTCDAPGTGPASPPPAYDPAVQRPLDSPPENPWVTYGLRVSALSPDMANDYCVPVRIVYTKRVLDDDMVINGATSEGQRFDFYTTTPWQGFVSFDYPTSDPRMATRPPTYQVTLTAEYVPADDTLHAGGAVAMACDVQIEGATFKRDLSSDGLCTVTWTDNRYNHGS